MTMVQEAVQFEGALQYAIPTPDWSRDLMCKRPRVGV